MKEGGGGGGEEGGGGSSRVAALRAYTGSPRALLIQVVIDTFHYTVCVLILTSKQYTFQSVLLSHHLASDSQESQFRISRKSATLFCDAFRMRLSRLFSALKWIQFTGRVGKGGLLRPSQKKMGAVLSTVGWKSQSLVSFGT